MSANRTRSGVSSGLLPVGRLRALHAAARRCRADAEALALTARPTRRRSLLLDSALRAEELTAELLRLRECTE